MVSSKVKTIRDEFYSLKNEVIGLIRLRSSRIVIFELVVVDNGDTVDTINVTQFGIVNESFSLPKSIGTYHSFPDGQNMNELLTDPYAWETFMNRFI